MSKQKLEKELRKELEMLNEQIDRKIVRGLSYSRESQRHRYLVSAISNIRRSSQSRSGWFSRSLGFVSTFIL